MNKRIRELAEQAGFYVSDNKIHIPTTSEDITACQTKFAELIVQECAQIADDCVVRDLNFPGEYIKEHFGVEE